MEEADSRGLNRVFASLASPSFRILFTGMLFSSAGMQMNIVSRPWLAFDLTGSALALGAVAAARAVPQLALAPIGGVAADRFDKRTVLMITQSGLAVLALLNAVLVHMGVIEIWHLIVIGLGQGVLFPFTMPARQAFVPELAGDRLMANALAIDSSGRNLSRIVVPSIVGVLLAWSPTVAFYAVAVMYVGAVLTLFALPRTGPASRDKGWSLAELTVGFRYILAKPILRMLVGMGFLVVVLGMPYQHLLPVFQSDVLDVGPQALGFMYTAVGVGGLSGSLVVAYLADYPRKGMLQIGAGIVFGLGLALFALSKVYGLSLVLLAVVGFTSQAYLTLNRVEVLQQTERALFGRVMSVYSMTWALAPMSVLPMGALVDAIGAPATVSGSSFILAGALLLIAVSFPWLWRRGGATSSRPSSGPA